MAWLFDQPDITSRLLLGTALYPSPEIMRQSIVDCKTQIITVSLRRQQEHHTDAKHGSRFWDYIKDLGCKILPNTAGCRTAKEAVTTAHMAREVFNTDWIKLEVIGDDYNLQPDPFELLIAAKQLIKDGFEVFPYCTEDLILCQRLVEAGCNILMPWAAPIGTGQGLLNCYAMKLLRARLPNITMIIDAGIGAPSHAARAMELGFDGVLINSAVALASDPVKMACAFADAVNAGRGAFESGIMPPRNMAQPSTPTLGTPFWHQEI